ncbi:Na+/H+ antiporter NhaC family protein [Microbulbifer thermotolerans]|uniref:Na+/H+ antiporter NhaC family protein n=1 Tax=Microbulbifer thermotolerans TaxID=252514 RepID=A0A143HLG5_MICTH|nr:Na+/H+ antiporter NhaC family protein [Microbulbifer thermotolerans]AMX02102.1 sodium:proton antiporter [Microbulbifer thermotolerans]MCX2778942.1 Na+/H+ antiporter NhaC family protein [Microbulbifer thermotolerans]MCX2781426.1 Na+/H+ antiporter NhaC family protein [Microbulbifer thermotolerans]MCX2793827.1 Na+/H+ antiporter NhaC family protein [Microbulbifer thermotolerans]MCX2802388.1 Na+/H+ antiporter NhaC family protein [Microbulbifer thermotolerans]
MTKASPLALLPLFLFLGLFVGSGLWYQSQGVEMAFYQISAPVAILPAIALAVLLARGSLNHRIETFIRGAGDHTIVTMLLIYLLAGAFASVAKAAGGVDAAVNLGLSAIPPTLVLPGLFVITAFIATAMGTSMGTVAAITPIAVGMANATDLPLLLTVGTIVGGAMFGDNLSIISDTTIAATRTQGVEMRDKFRMNFRIALPAALVTVSGLYFLGSSAVVEAPGDFEPLRVLPYLVVLCLAVSGVNVLLTLFTGLLLAGAIGLTLQPDYGLAALSRDVYAGYTGMQEILILSLLIGGLGAMMQAGGGLAWLATAIDKLNHSRRRGASATRIGELGISTAVAATNVCTANNTVAILLTGSLAKDIAQRYGVDPRRSASLLDIFSCAVQGLLPYGAQVLLASSLAKVSPLALIGNIYYCWLLGIAALISIAIGLPRETLRQADTASSPAD